MNCWIERHHFMQARSCVEPPPRKKDDVEPDTPPMLRIEATGESAKISSAFGEATVAAKVPRSGIVFVPLEGFMTETEGIGEGKWVEVEAAMRSWGPVVKVSGRVIVPAAHCAIFSDPAQAPERWEPSNQPAAQQPRKERAGSKPNAAKKRGSGAGRRPPSTPKE